MQNGGGCCFSSKESTNGNAAKTLRDFRSRFCRRQNHLRPTTRTNFSVVVLVNASSSSLPPEYARNVNTEEVQNDENAYVLNTYGRGKSRVITHGKGVYCFDSEGNEYLDFTAGIAVNCLGHADEKLAEVIAE